MTTSQNGIVFGSAQVVNGLTVQADLIGPPALLTGDSNDFAPGCYLLERDATTNFLLKVWQNTGTTAVPVWSLVGTADQSGVVTLKVSIASAAILTLHSVPVQVLPAPGVGMVSQVISVTGRMNFLTAAYATHTELDIVDASLGSKLFEDTSILLAATSTKVAQIPAVVNANAGILVTADGAVNAIVATGDPVTGAGSLDLYITYKEITL